MIHLTDYDSPLTFKDKVESSMIFEHKNFPWWQQTKHTNLHKNQT